MKILALVLPGTGDIGGRINNTPGYTGQTTLGGVASDAYRLGFYAAAFLMFIWLAWGVFQYILAQGNKEGLAKARARIQWAILGFIIFILSILVSQYTYSLFPQVSTFNGGNNVQQLSPTQ